MHRAQILLFPLVGTTLGWGSAAPIPGAAEVLRKESAVVARAERIREAYQDKELLSLGILDVTRSPYGADPTGKTDVTASLQRALDDARDTQSICYLPPGDYLVSDTIVGVQGIIEWDEWLYGDPYITNPYLSLASFAYPNVIMGSRGDHRARIRLQDRAPGFDDGGHPKPVLYFRARSIHEEERARDADAPTISFNQKILHLDFDLGTGNPGAVALAFRAAEGSTVEDVRIRAHGAFAGIKDAPGSGGSMQGITVEGGRHGLYLVGTQPSPLVSDLTLTGQEEYSIYADTRGPLTIVGARIEGAGIRAVHGNANYDGALNLVDVSIALRSGTTAIEAVRSVVLENVWVNHAPTLLRVEKEANVRSLGRGWNHLRRVAVGSSGVYPAAVGSKPWKDRLWIDRRTVETPVMQIELSEDAPPDFPGQHRYRRLPDPLDPGVVNVKEAPYGAHGAGGHDDTDAIQKAIDTGQPVFLPKGDYTITRPLRLQAKTVLFGVSNLHSTLTTRNAKPDRSVAPHAPFTNPTFPDALIETVDDPGAETFLGMIRLQQPALNPCVTAILWRAGAASTVQNVYAHQTGWHSAASMKSFPLIRVTGSGGGAWYNVENFDYWCHGPDHRLFMADGTHEPLRIYHLQPQFNRSLAMVEFRNAANIDVYSSKCEGDHALLWIRRCHNVRLFGLNGLIVPRPGRAVLRVDNSRDLLLANVSPIITRQGQVHWGDFITFHSSESLLLRDGDFAIGGLEQFALYLLGNPRGASFPRP